MSIHVDEESISTAWLRVVEELVQAGGDTPNLAVAIRDPLSIDEAVRERVDQFVRGLKLKGVTTVANTIFPTALYPAHLEVGAREHLYEMWERVRGRLKKRHYYFDRLYRWPSGEQQLETCVKKLIWARERGNKNNNECALEMPLGDAGAVDLPIYRVENDKKIVCSFPCLSHVSVSLCDGRLNMTALYRNHHVVSKGLGNYIGLGRLLAFLANESGWEIGELMVVASHAELDKVGCARMGELVSECRKLVVA